MTFTDKPPTEPGFYAWKPNSGGHEDLVTVYEDHLGGLMTIGTAMSWPDREPPAVKAGLWCRLVPAEEVEKAFMEGHHYGYCCANHIDMDKRKDDWQNSRARRVATGEER